MKSKSITKGVFKTGLGSMPDASGANYVSRNDLHLDPGTQSGKTRASQRVPYKARPGIAGKSEATPTVIGSPDKQAGGPEGFGPSFVGEDVDTVKAVARDLNPIERARQKNNRTRDTRTNLGRGKPSIPTVE